MKKIEDLIDQYLNYLKLEKNYSENTLDTYSHYLNRFLEWMDVDQIDGVSPTLVRNYQIKLYDYRDEKGDKLAAKTRNYHLIALRGFLRYLVVQRELNVMPPEKVSLGKISERQISVLEIDELKDLFSAPNTKSKLGKRDKAILELLFSTGLRVSELVALNREQINFKTREISVKGKGGRVRVVFISERATKSLQEYLATREDDYIPLFIRYRGPTPEESAQKDGEGWRLSARSVQRLVKKYGRKAGLSKDATPHTLRHSLATDLLRGGADIREVQELLGHKNIATTQIYTHVTDRRLKKVFEEAHSGNA